MSVEGTTPPTPPSSPGAPIAEPALADDHEHASLRRLSIGALGVVYGDIGTSPLYAIRESLHGLHATGHDPELMRLKIMGVLSLATWSLIIVVVLKYLTLALRADNRGEGGILALLALLVPSRTPTQAEGKPRSGRGRGWMIVLGLFAAALLMADGMITPAISVLSAIEGLEVTAPQLHEAVIPVTVVILVIIFAVQRRGAGALGAWFGPPMILWFSLLAMVGIANIFNAPSVLAALSPHYAVQLAWVDPRDVFFVLGSVVLVVTGAEALYADMGHFGRKPIRVAWYCIVMPALLLNYYGQGAAVLDAPAAATNPFWYAVPTWFRYPMLGVATMATIIASQALISGAFSLTQQAVQLGYAPRMKVQHTSAAMRGQIYVPIVNWGLMIACVGLVFIFGSSSNLAAMYGVAVTGTMAVTTIMLYRVSREQWRWPLIVAVPVMGLFLLVDLLFFSSNLFKLDDGGWVALLVAGVIFAVVFIWYVGRRVLARSFDAVSLPMHLFLADVVKQKVVRVPGVAVFMSGRPGVVPAVLLHHLKHNRVLHEKVVLLSVRTLSQPRADSAERLAVRPLEAGFHEATLSYGFMETPNVPEALDASPDIDLGPPDQVSYYLGRVTLRLTGRGRMPRWAKRIFSLLHHNERPATEFFSLPPNRVVELGRHLEL